MDRCLGAGRGTCGATAGYAVRQSSAITQIPGPPVYTVSYTGILTITTDKGALTTRGVGVFETGPFGIGVQFDRVIGGTGLFAGATGFLYYTFTGDASGAAFTSVVSGEICVR